MPYFIIIPAYIVLLTGLVMAGLLSLAIKPFRPLSGYIFCGALGTIPGFIFGNVFFWAATFAVASLLPESATRIDFGTWSEGVAIGFGLLVVAGLAMANVIGCLFGFLGGVLVLARLKRATPANKPGQADKP